MNTCVHIWPYIAIYVAMCPYMAIGPYIMWPARATYEGEGIRTFLHNLGTYGVWYDKARFFQQKGMESVVHLLTKYCFRVLVQMIPTWSYHDPFCCRQLVLVSYGLTMFMIIYAYIQSSSLFGQVRVSSQIVKSLQT